MKVLQVVKVTLQHQLIPIRLTDPIRRRVRLTMNIMRIDNYQRKNFIQVTMVR